MKTSSISVPSRMYIEAIWWGVCKRYCKSFDESSIRDILLRNSCLQCLIAHYAQFDKGVIF